jgi:hypothetical protein
MLIAICLALVSTSCLSQTRTEQQHTAGDLVVIAPAVVDDARSVWMLVYPRDFRQYQVENGKLFLAMPKHDVLFKLLIVPNDQDKPLDLIDYDLIVGSTIPDPKPNPTPDPVDPISPQHPWVNWVVENKQLLSDLDKATLKEMGQNFTDGSKQTFSTSLDMTVWIRDRNRVTLGTNWMKAVDWSTALQEKMIEAELSDNLSKAKEACYQIGMGLQELAK